MNTGNLRSDAPTLPPGPAAQSVALVPLPQVYEFAMAAIAAQEIVQGDSATTDDAGGGSPGLFHSTYCYLSVAVVCFIATIIHLV